MRRGGAQNLAGQRAYVITLGRAGEDNKSFRLTDLDSTFAGFAGADYDLQVCCAVLCCAVLCCAVLCCAVLVVLRCPVPRGTVRQGQLGRPSGAPVQVPML
jgi:hypothetical protein